MPKSVMVSTNIGEEQVNRSTACQAAVGVAVAGADLVKAGLARLTPDEAAYLCRSIVRSVHGFCRGKGVYPVFFVDPELVNFFPDPLIQGPELAAEAGAAGILIDTFDKSRGKGLLDYVTVRQISRFARNAHSLRIKAWIAGSIRTKQLSDLWKTGIDVICVRREACANSNRAGRFGTVSRKLVAELVATIPE